MPGGRGLLEAVTSWHGSEIAQRLSISEATVRFHVGNRTEAVQVAFKQRLVEL